MEREEILKNYICMKYKSVRQFTIDKNLKYSTVASLLSHSLGKANIDTVFEICKALNISADALIERGIIVEKPKEENTVEVVGIKFRNGSKIYYFSPNGISFEKVGNLLINKYKEIFY